HATDRTTPRLVPDDLRVHRASPLRPRACRRRRDGPVGVRLRRRRRHVALRVRHELLTAALTAEPVRLASVVGTAARCLSRNYIHPADGVLLGDGRGGVVVMSVMLFHGRLLRPY